MKYWRGWFWVKTHVDGAWHKIEKEVQAETKEEALILVAREVEIPIMIAEIRTPPVKKNG